MTHGFWIGGEPIAGEDRREAAWRAGIADLARGHAPSSPVRGVTLTFIVRPGRRIDADNLARPAMAALQDAGWCSRGFAGLDRLVVKKCIGEEQGLIVATSPGFEAPPSLSPSMVTVRHEEVPVSDRRDALRAWYHAVAAHHHRHFVGPVAVAVEVGTTLSLPGLMKPIIDGLEPILGRDPAGTSEFAPLDEQVTCLVMQRVREGSGLVVRVGPAPAPPAHTDVVAPRRAGDRGPRDSSTP